MTISIEKQIACVRRELAMRLRNYPRWVEAKKMKQAEMDHQLAAMQAVHDTLTAISAASDATELVNQLVLLGAFKI